jgi:hypothetical protein
MTHTIFDDANDSFYLACEKEKFSFKFSCIILLVEHFQLNAEYLESETSSETMIVLEDDQKVMLCPAITVDLDLS